MTRWLNTWLHDLGFSDFLSTGKRDPDRTGGTDLAWADAAEADRNWEGGNRKAAGRDRRHPEVKAHWDEFRLWMGPNCTCVCVCMVSMPRCACSVGSRDAARRRSILQTVRARVRMRRSCRWSLKTSRSKMKNWRFGDDCCFLEIRV